MWKTTRYIYIITCLANGKKYVGRTIRPEERFRAHLSSLKSGKHSNEALQADFNIYGEDAFDIELLGEDTMENGKSDEAKWMEYFKTYDEEYGYNSKDTAMNQVRKANGLSYRAQPKEPREFYPRSEADQINIKILRNERYERICKLYNDGHTVRTIAESEGCSYQAVGQIISKCKAKTDRSERAKLAIENEKLKRQMNKVIKFVTEQHGEEFITKLLDET